MLAVPISQREAVLALGATRWEMMRIGCAAECADRDRGRGDPGLGPRSGRDHGRDHGDRQPCGYSRRACFPPAYTLASVIANEFTEATGDMYLSALIEIGLALFLVTIMVNAIARVLVWAVTRGAPINEGALSALRTSR